ncbi:DNA polymerase epsilon catalytic subunit, partial [Cladochytrium tenue]
LVKAVVAVLELDPVVEREVRALRRDLLGLLNVREFAPEARLPPPDRAAAAAVRIPRVVCEYCNMTRDLDLTRDEAGGGTDGDASSTNPLVQNDGDDDEEAEADGGSQGRRRQAGEAASGPRWPCPGCGAEPDAAAVEQALVGSVLRQLTAWQVQDVRCGRCGAVRAEELAEHCRCAGGPAATLDGAAAAARLAALAAVAEHYSMPALAAAVAWARGDFGGGGGRPTAAG